MTYPSTPHPEDSPGFEGYPRYVQEPPQWAEEQSARPGGKVDVIEAVGWAFRAVFSNKRVWILGSFLMMFIIGALGFAVAFSVLGLGGGSAEVAIDALPQGWKDLTPNLVSGLSMLLLTPFLCAGALAQVSKKKGQWAYFFQNLNYGAVFLAALASYAVTSLLPYLLALVGGLGGEAFDDDIQAVFVLLALGIGGLLTFFLSPLVFFWEWFAAEGQSAKAAISRGLTAGKCNYWALLLYGLIAPMVMVFAIVFTLGLGLFVFPAVYLLANAHMARQAFGGPLPARN